METRELLPAWAVQRWEERWVTLNRMLMRMPWEVNLPVLKSNR
jgi:hypothetical protein